MSVLLGVNVDHVASLRQARGTDYPCPLKAANIAVENGADLITVHLREDRRHIQDFDVINLKKYCSARLNLEMATVPEMIDFAVNIKPDDCCLVPEKRHELTTEGGLDLISNFGAIKASCNTLTLAGIKVSLFIEPEIKVIDLAYEIGAKAIELHTGPYSNAKNSKQHSYELARLIKASNYANSLGLQVNAGHGLHYDNVTDISNIKYIKELNIGHGLIANAMFDGLALSVRKMKRLLA